MPKKIPLPPEKLAWLEENHDTASYETMAEHIGCCVDTLKRILVRRGLQEFDAAKYAVSRVHDRQTWRRPCIRCGSTQERDRGYYMCLLCRAKAGYME
jgi:hypothetical protein